MNSVAVELNLLSTVDDNMQDNTETDPPCDVMIYSRDYVVLGEQNTLICHVSGFYPAPVNVSWAKNGDKVTKGTSINVPFPDKDGSFTQISRLVFIPQQGDIYSCSVEHLALTEPVTRFWSVDKKTQPDMGYYYVLLPEIFYGVGLTVGLLGIAVGTLFIIKGHKRS